MPRPRTNPERLKEQTFHHLKLLSFTIKKNHRYWLCQCECGGTVTRREDAIIKGATKSCGCKHPRRNKGQNHPTWKGCGQLNGQYYSHLKQMAELRGHQFNVSINFLWQLFVEQGGRCALTNLPICFQAHKDKMKGAIQTASLDRIDSSRGYETDNVQWVHKDVNRMKRDFPIERFLEICRLVTEHGVAQLIGAA